MSLVRGLAVAALTFALPALAQGSAKPSFSKELSADVVVTVDKNPPLTQRVYFSKSRIRSEVKVNGQEMVVLYDLGGKKSWMLMPAQKMAMDLSGSMAAAMGGQQGGTQSGPEELLSDPQGNPCGLKKDPKLTCKKLGTEKVNGRTADKWQMVQKVNGTEDKSTVWVDQELKLMVKREGSQGDVMELKNIKEGPQPASLFEVPKGYQIMSIPAMPGGAMPGMPGGALPTAGGEE